MKNFGSSKQLKPVPVSYISLAAFTCSCVSLGEDQFSQEATSALEEMTRGEPLLAQVNAPSLSKLLYSLQSV